MNRGDRDPRTKVTRATRTANALASHAHCSLMCARRTAHASRYISTRPPLPLSPTVPISPAYIHASPTVTQHASASAIRSAHPPRLRVTRRPNPLALPNQHISVPTTPTEHTGSRVSNNNSAFHMSVSCYEYHVCEIPSQGPEHLWHLMRTGTWAPFPVDTVGRYPTREAALAAIPTGRKRSRKHNPEWDGIPF